MTHPVRLGLKYAPMATTPERMREVWVAADQAGFDHLWIMDHFMPLVRSATGWYQFEPGQCQVLWPGKLQYRYYLVYAQNKQSGREWKGDEQWLIPGVYSSASM